MTRTGTNRQAQRTSKPVLFEASGLLNPQPTGVGVYGRGVVRGILEAGNTIPTVPASFELICPVTRWRRRAAASDLGLPVRPYFSGRFLTRRGSLVHLLDTRCPRDYRGPLVATVFDTISALPLSEELGLASEKFRRKKLHAYHEIASRADVIITLSWAVRDEIRGRFPAARRVEVIRPGLDLPDESRLRPKAEDILRAYGIQRPFLLAVGALCPRKNIETVVAAFEGARRRWPDLGLVLVGSPEYGWETSAGARRVKDSAGPIHLPGYVPREALWAALMAARCVLQLSHYEGFGLTVLEALAVGTPVVASRRGGLPEAGGGLAWLVDPDNTEAVVAALERVLRGGPEIAAHQRKGRMYAASHTWKKAGSTVLRLYDDLIGSRR